MIANVWAWAFRPPFLHVVSLTDLSYAVNAVMEVDLPWKCKLFLSSVTDFICMETRRENSAPACQWASAKLTVAVIVQSHTPKIPVWRVHEGWEWVCGCLVTLGSEEAGYLCFVEGYQWTCPHWRLEDWQALSERGQVHLMKGASSCVQFHALLLTCHKWNLWIFISAVFWMPGMFHN